MIYFNRLSKFAGDTLRTGNHTLTDLSDPYRPTKIAEHYGELYDNLWTDALDALLKTNQERPAIEILGNILKVLKLFIFETTLLLF